MKREIFTFVSDKPKWQTIWGKLPNEYEHKGLLTNKQIKCVLFIYLNLSVDKKDWKERVALVNDCLNGNVLLNVITNKLNLKDIPNIPETFLSTYNPDDIPVELLYFIKLSSFTLLQVFGNDISDEMIENDKYDGGEFDTFETLTVFNCAYLHPFGRILDYVFNTNKITIKENIPYTIVSSRTEVIDIIQNKIIDQIRESDLGILPISGINIEVNKFAYYKQ